MPKMPHVKRKYDLLLHRIRTGYFYITISAALSRPGSLLYPLDAHEIQLTRKSDALTQELNKLQCELADYREWRQRQFNIQWAMTFWFR